MLSCRAALRVCNAARSRFPTSTPHSLVSSRTLYLSSVAAAVGCDKLPDLTIIWPFHLWPSDVVATMVDNIQQSSGMPWWTTILVGGVLIKLPIYSYNIYSLRKTQQFLMTSPKQITNFVMKYFENLVTKGETHALKMANDERRFTLTLANDYDDNYNREHMFSHVSYRPLYYLAGLHMSMLMGLHWLNRIQYIPLQTGGLPWCLDLTSADPYMVLPAVALATAVANFYTHPAHFLFPVPEVNLKNIKVFAPLFATGFCVLSALPADILLYMVSVNLIACLFNSILKFPKVHTEFGLISSGEIFNRMVPPAHVFKELNKTMERQVLLLEQKKEQEAAVAEGKLDKKLGLETSERKLLNNDIESEKLLPVLDDEAESSGKNEDIRFIRTGKDDGRLLEPHLNVKKNFYGD